MSSPREARRESGRGNDDDESDSDDLNFQKTLPSSSQKKTPTKKVFENTVKSEVKSSPLTFSSKNYEYLFQEHSESESDGSDFSHRDRWDSEDTELAGPSKTASPRHPDIDSTVSEKELAQLAHIRPLVFNYSTQTVMKGFLKMLQKKEEYDIIREFLELEQMTVPDDFKSGNELLNKDKNRYRDILPYDSTRVPLGKHKDYINASYIRIVNHDEEYLYIATQGPLPETIEDFWQMVMENNCNVIAMITREIEGGVIKCHSYWPITLKEPLELKQFRILLENFQITQYFIIRVFQIVKKSTGMSHCVKHLQFTKWPDHGTPASADFFIKYVRYVRKSHITGPLIVHCSAGVGRTGVLICVDVVFCAIERNYSFNILNIVTQMRKQRQGMIQTKEQYHFCYEIVLEVLQDLLTLS
ncbi:tyrosine-protein phosphatase non-receptor type 20 isoform X1 [Onychomys torridus]|uniref:tyrosine-protein phosphatase non-receptor type 20 isoform X1 n=2 Tax=Onychomys torridus TaxID=38674 RepID=UPI00167F7BB7|nr:tyrosine-protein phosphatase non-receptor type 20 isoform X1 [Onychomys torridus]XP_036054683.1 tyrosine-protein phosphatase non-receptor type 20 isoform X1 [Onychomys torridus]XP_036054684.1 tyrosine-protein phosphatase non-receptor type 20 isoform X1 [Onychomys torridus]